MLANLYIASYQLHSTLDFKEVLQIILEIVRITSYNVCYTKLLRADRPVVAALTAPSRYLISAEGPEGHRCSTGRAKSAPMP